MKQVCLTALATFALTACGMIAAPPPVEMSEVDPLEAALPAMEGDG